MYSAQKNTLIYCTYSVNTVVILLILFISYYCVWDLYWIIGIHCFWKKKNFISILCDTFLRKQNKTKKKHTFSDHRTTAIWVQVETYVCVDCYLFSVLALTMFFLFECLCVCTILWFLKNSVLCYRCNYVMFLFCLPFISW